MTKRLPSLDLIATTIRDERATQIQHFQAIDTKAGVILGFSSALVALGGRGDKTLAGIGQIVAIMAALTALGAFWPRSYPVLDLRALRDGYVTAEEQFTRLHLVDTQILMVREASNLLESKSRRLRFSMLGLFVAAAFVATAILFVR